jgi:peptide/nickel transport system substrate-binding protein
MRRTRRTIAVAALLGMLGGLVLSGTASAQSASPSQEKVVFVEGTTNDMRTVNPFRALETPEYEVLSMNYDLFLNFDKATLGPAPGLATEWTQSEDGLTWTFKVRDDATWQDGQPLTAGDVAFTYNMVIDYKFGNALDYLPFTDSITAPDDTTLIWKTTKPTTAPLYPPWVYIVPEHVWGSWSKDEARKWTGFDEGSPPVGSGPFQLTQWTKGESWSLTANKGYWAGAPQIDEYVVRKYNNAEAMISALKRGEIDYVSVVPVDLFDSLNGAQGITTHVGPATGFGQMSFNSCDPSAADAAPYCAKEGSTANPALYDPAIREAISWAIDRETIVDKVLAGYGAPGTTIVPPFAKEYHWEPPADQLIGFDIAKANQILDDAGYMDSNGDGVREDGNGKPLEFRFILRSESDVGAQLGKYISGWLKQIGITTNNEVLTDGKLVDAWYANDYDMYIWGWAPDPDPDFILSTFTSGQCGGWSDTCFSDAQFDQLYDDQRTATNLEDRQAIIDQMQEIIYTEIPEVVLYYDKSLEAFRSDRWTGLMENQSPEPEGFLLNQYTPYSLLTLAPIGAGGGSSATSGSGGISPVIWLGILGAVVIVVAIVVLARRGKSDEDMA